MNWIEKLNKRQLVSSLAKKKIGILGAAKSGVSAALLAKKVGAVPFVSEHKEISKNYQDILHREHVEFEEYGHTAELLGMDLIIISPGVPGNIPIVQEIEDNQIPVISEIEFAYWFDLGHVVAITGSQGKTTTTTLIGNLFDAAGKVAFVGGNIGFPYANFAASSLKQTWSIIEVSSFQLEHIIKFQPKVVVLTNITPNHLDRYEGFDDYAAAKLNILKNLDNKSLVIYNYDDEVLREHFSSNSYKFKTLTFSQEIKKGVNAFITNETVVTHIKNIAHELIKKEEVKLLGPHNLYNVMASGLTALSLGISIDNCKKVFKFFSGLEHRLELVDNVEGVYYYNDSKCTTVAALKYSLQSFNQKIVLIAGGKDKGGRFFDLRSIVEEKVKAVILIGEATDRIFSEWGGSTLIYKAGSLEDAMNKAKLEADEGDVVLLSPACSSFDMFTNFENRGTVFKKIVKKFKEESNE